MAAPYGVRAALGTWYLRDQGLRRILRVRWDSARRDLSASLAIDSDLEDQAPVALRALRWRDDGSLSFRVAHPEDASEDHYALRVREGVLTGRVAAHVPRAQEPSRTDHRAHVTGWNLESIDAMSSQRTWDLLIDGAERATLRIDRSPGEETAFSGTLKVYASVARGIADEGPERDLGVLRWDGARVEFFTRDGGVQRLYSATVIGRHIEGWYLGADGSRAGVFRGTRRDVLGYGLAPRAPEERDAWATRARAQLGALLMAGNPTPTHVEVVTRAQGITPYPDWDPNPTRDDDLGNHPPRYRLSEVLITSTLPALPGEIPLKRETRALIARPEGPPPPEGFAVAITLNGHWGSARQMFIPDSPYWYGDAFARRGYLVVAVDVSHRPVDERGGLYTDIPHGDAPTEGNVVNPSIRAEGMDSDWEEDGERAWDAMRALDVALREPDVNRARVTLLGLSMGGEVASIAGALDQRFGVVIPAAFSPDVAVYAYRHHPCWDWVHADVNEFVDVSDYHAMVAPRALVVETGAEDIAYSIAAEPFAADKQVLRRSRAAFADRPERVVHFFHPDAHSFQVGDLRVDGAPSRGVTAPELTAPASPWSLGWQTDRGVQPVAPTLFELVTRLTR